jgi:N6-adenosine-specific RNA methylase IME4
MSLNDMKKLPVAQFAAKNCALFMWVTDPFLPAGLELISAWGFTYKTVAFYWVKTNTKADLTSLSENDFFTGLGYWTRANPE